MQKHIHIDLKKMQNLTAGFHRGGEYPVLKSNICSLIRPSFLHVSSKSWLSIFLINILFSTNNKGYQIFSSPWVWIKTCNLTENKECVFVQLN